MKLSVENLINQAKNTNSIQQNLLERLESTQARECFGTQQFRTETGSDYNKLVAEIRSTTSQGSLSQEVEQSTTALLFFASTAVTVSRDLEQSTENVTLQDWQSQRKCSFLLSYDYVVRKLCIYRR